MKRNTFISGLILSVVLIGVTSCEKTNDQLITDLEGTYIGLFTKSSSLKSALSDESGEDDGIAEITMMDDNQIRVHCYGNEIDTTFMLEIYEDHDDFFVCQTGDGFHQEYGHMKGVRHMGHMMGSQTEWMHHLNDDHEDGDEHFGAFDMGDGTFSYAFRMTENHSSYYLKFHGIKE